MTETPDLGELGADPAPDVEQSPGETTDEIGLAALLALGIGPETVDYLRAFDLDAFLDGRDPWPEEPTRDDGEPDS